MPTSWAKQLPKRARQNQPNLFAYKISYFDIRQFDLYDRRFWRRRAGSIRIVAHWFAVKGRQHHFYPNPGNAGAVRKRRSSRRSFHEYETNRRGGPQTSNLPGDRPDARRNLWTQSRDFASVGNAGTASRRGARRGNAVRL